MDLLKETKRLIDRHTDEFFPNRISNAELCKKVGVQYGWFMTFRRGKIPNPGVVSIQALYDYLSRRDQALKNLGVRINSRKKVAA